MTFRTRENNLKVGGAGHLFRDAWRNWALIRLRHNRTKICMVNSFSLALQPMLRVGDDIAVLLHTLAAHSVFTLPTFVLQACYIFLRGAVLPCLNRVWARRIGTCGTLESHATSAWAPLNAARIFLQLQALVYDASVWTCTVLVYTCILLALSLPKIP